MSGKFFSASCSSAVRDDLKAYLDHELTPLARLRVWRHLQTCALCAKETAMLQATQARLKTAMPGETPSQELRGHIRAQIDLAGLTDERVRRDKSRSGLVPRRFLSLAATVSAVVTVACLYAMIAPIREKARQAALRSPNKQVGLALLQYDQDYDETFPASKTTNPHSGKGLPANSGDTLSPPLVIVLRTAHPDAAVDAVCLTYPDASLMIVDKDVTVDAMSSHQIAHLESDLQKIGRPDLVQVHRTQRTAKSRPGTHLSVTIRIVPEAAR